ncbi:flippase [Limosilactobacillus reuteri]|uniref:flippase n=1 Tax=Limosilactobacillus reuteri TaxID=1598 RepID=UPI00128C6A4D|nr:flippase [Limosilactobacillus reuteri]MQB57973.1 flippase [Limosilactobacillus reuteri]MQC03484.1 flippase [Limosilactobacillus reuteri]
MKKKSLGINAVLNSFQSFLNLIFPLITFPYVARVLSVDGVGKYNFANSIVSYFILLAALGISTFAVREGAKLRNDRKAISEFASKVFTINIVSASASYLLLFLLLTFTPSLHQYVSAILIFSVQIFFTTIGTDWVYIIFEEYGYITLRNIFFKIISIVMLFLFVRHSNDYLIYASITVFASSGSYVLNFFHAKKFCDIKINFNIPWKNYLIPIFTIFASTIAIQIYVNSDMTLLGLLKDDYSVGIYSTSVKIYQIAAQMLTAMLAVTIPRLALLMGQGKLEEYNEVLNKLINVLMLIVLPGTVGLFFLSKNVILIIAGSKYINSTASLKILCFAILGSALSTVFNQCILIPTKREKKTLISSSISALFNIGLNFILIPLFAEKGTALTTVLSEFLMMSLNFYFSRDITEFVFKNKNFWHNLMIILIGCLGILISCILCQLIFKQIFLNLISSVLLSTLVYISIVVGLKNSIAIDLISNIKYRLRLIR